MKKRNTNKVYIAGKITGDDCYKVKFKDAEDKLLKSYKQCMALNMKGEYHCCNGCIFYDRDYITMCRIYSMFPSQMRIVNPVDLNLENKPYWVAIAKCLWKLSRCRYVYMLSDWQQSRGAKIEHKVAGWLKKQIIYQR